MVNSMLQVLEEPSLNEIEMAYMVGKHSISTRTFAVYVPKIMAMIGHGSKKETSKMSINKSMFVNDTETKPDVSTTVPTKNYISAKLYPNGSTSNSSNRDVDAGTIGPDNRMVIHFIDRNVNTRYVNEVL